MRVLPAWHTSLTQIESDDTIESVQKLALRLVDYIPWLLSRGPGTLRTGNPSWSEGHTLARKFLKGICCLHSIGYITFCRKKKPREVHYALERGLKQPTHCLLPAPMIIIPFLLLLLLI